MHIKEQCAQRNVLLTSFPVVDDFVLFMRMYQRPEGETFTAGLLFVPAFLEKAATPPVLHA
jgi:hypothetical protein